MGCCGSDREKEAAVRAEQKWEYIVSGFGPDGLSSPC